MSTVWKILVLAARESEVKPLRQTLAEAQRPAELRLVRDVGQLTQALDSEACDAVLLTASVSHLHLAQSLAEIRSRDALMPVLLVVHASEAAPVVAAVRTGVSAVVFIEALPILPSTLERELAFVRERRQRRKSDCQRQILAAAFEASPLAMAVVDGKGRVRSANAAFLSATGLNAAGAVGGGVDPWSEDASAAAAAAAGRQAGRSWQGTVAIPGSSGAVRCDATARPFAGPDEEPWAVLVLAQGARTAAEAPAPQAADAGLRTELFAAIAGGIAHDLNNILAPITMAANLLREQHLDDEESDLVDTIEHSAERGAAVIRQVLTFARGSENCAMVLQPRFVVREVARLAAEVFPPNIGVRAEVPAGLWTIVGDPGEIQQALINILLNARDAMPDGGHVLISASNATVQKAPVSSLFDSRPGEFVEILVSDTGQGFDPEVAERVWEPFVTTKGSGQGAGLGLSRVAGVMRSHGGFAQLQSRPGKGTGVRLFFPRAAVDAARPEAVGESEQARPSVRILVVDDEEAILDLSRRVLERAGYEVLVASEGREALGIFSRYRSEIGLVITDLSMPGMNGFTLVWALRRSKPDLRVIVATGQSSEANLRELERMGVRQVLLKPFSSRRMLDAVAQALAEPPICEPDLFLDALAVNE